VRPVRETAGVMEAAGVTCSSRVFFLYRYISAGIVGAGRVPARKI
jgi:hypothetical protein